MVAVTVVRAPKDVAQVDSLLLPVHGLPEDLIAIESDLLVQPRHELL